MAGITIDITNIGPVTTNLTKIEKVGSPFYRLIRDKLLVTAKGHVQKEMPVDKGGLRKSAIIQNRTANEGFVRANIKYAPFVHEGTYDFRGDPRDYGGSGRLGSTRSRGFRGLGGFNYIDKASGKKGIRPNRFAERALKLTENDQRAINKAVGDAIKKFIK